MVSTQSPVRVTEFHLCLSTSEIRFSLSNGKIGVSTVHAPSYETEGRPWIGGPSLIPDRQAEELAEVAFWALQDRECHDPRFAGWDTDSWSASDAQWDAHRAALAEIMADAPTCPDGLRSLEQLKSDWDEPTAVDTCVSLVGRAATAQRLAVPRAQEVDADRMYDIDGIMRHDLDLCAEVAL